METTILKLMNASPEEIKSYTLDDIMEAIDSSTEIQAVIGLVPALAPLLTIPKVYKIGKTVYSTVTQQVVPAVVKVKGKVEKATMPPPVGVASAAVSTIEEESSKLMLMAKQEAEKASKEAMITLLNTPFPIPGT